MDIKGLPVSGYRDQKMEAVEIVNGFKQDEEALLRKIDSLMSGEHVDKQWLAIGLTALEQAFMAINRSVFQPTRINLPSDDA